MSRGVFVTGTDTDAGKTWIAAGLLAGIGARGLRTGAIKPVASGAAATPAGLRSDDALRLQAAASVSLGYEEINPYVFAPPIAPHLAARQAGVAISIGALVQGYRAVAARCDWVVVEGVGGWMVPFDDEHGVADLAAALDLPVVMAVGLRLGCLNHALLTAAAIRQRGLALAGWAASHVGATMGHADENIATLRARLGAPLLGVVPHLPAFDPAAIARCLDVTPLLEGDFAPAAGRNEGERIIHSPSSCRPRGGEDKGSAG